jgi:4'-phosphopantetheinyl transferase
MRNVYNILNEDIIVYSTKDDSYDVLKKYLISYLTSNEIDKIEKYKNESQRINEIISYTLPKIELAKRLKINAKDINIVRDINKRPCYKDYTNYHYSISHSGNYVAFVLSEKNVGLDIEERQFRDMKALEYVATESEINDCQDYDDKFALWTFKEAYSKYIGKGISRELKKISLNGIKEDVQTIYINHLVITLVKEKNN